MFGKLLLPYKVVAIFTSVHIMYVWSYLVLQCFCFLYCHVHMTISVTCNFSFCYYWHIKYRPLSGCKWLFGFNDVYFVAWCFLAFSCCLRLCIDCANLSSMHSEGYEVVFEICMYNIVSFCTCTWWDYIFPWLSRFISITFLILVIANKLQWHVFQKWFGKMF